MKTSLEIVKEIERRIKSVSLIREEVQTVSLKMELSSIRDTLIDLLSWITEKDKE